MTMSMSMTMKMRSLIFVIGIPFAMAGTNCSNFECFNNSTCTDAAANFIQQPVSANGSALEFLKETSRGGKHCACPTGWTGLRCGTMYESCATSEKHSCFHGGKCIPGLEDIYGNKQLFCDCSTAIVHPTGTSVAFVGNTVQYVGKFCEIPSVPTEDLPVNSKLGIVACNANKTIFCVNGGTCKADYASSPQHPCRCGNDHDGPHCEFAKDSVPQCTLTCMHGGKCKLGMRTYTESSDQYLQGFFATNTDYQYCDCPKEYYGATCETKSTVCGNRHCFNGGQCKTTKLSNGTMTHNCDCTAGKQANKAFAGRYCQYDSTMFCDGGQTKENGQLFCSNGGTCKSGASHTGCDCPSGYHGPICEFKDTEKNDDYEKCNLKCKNNGVCRKGAKDMDFLGKFSGSVSHMNVSTNEDFEHCVCPAGFLGLTCEHKVQECGDGKKACFHDSKCVDEEGSDSTCECDAGFTAFDKLAGQYCQHKSTTICTENGNAELSKNNLAFCVNGGTCKGVVSTTKTGHPGCNCANGWVGDHCEYLESELKEMAKMNIQPIVSSTTSPRKRSGGAKFGMFLLITGCLALTVVAVMYALRIKKRRDAMHSMPGLNDNIAPNSGITVYEKPNLDNNAVVVDLGPNKDLDGNVLHNVDII